MSAPKIDKELFRKRMANFYRQWKAEDALKNIDTIAVMNGKEEITYSKTISLQNWLTGYELQDTIMFFCLEKAFFLASKRKAEFLRAIQSESEHSGCPPVSVLVRDLGDKDKANFKKMTSAAKSSGKGKTVGYFAKEKTKSDFINDFKASLKSSDMDFVDIAPSISNILAVKDEQEQTLMRKASDVTVNIFSKYLKEQIMDIVDQDKKTKHARLASGCEDSLKNNKLNMGLDVDSLDTCYPPIIQSGGAFQLKYSLESNKEVLHFGIIICSLGVRYRNYCSNVVRTLMVNPTEKQQQLYEFVVNVEEFAISEMRDGVQFSTLAEKIIEKVNKEKPEIADKLLKSFGFVTGLEFRDSHLVITQKSTAVFASGMTVNFGIGFSDLDNPDATRKQDRKYALWVSDVLLIKKDEPAECLTATAKKRMKSVRFVVKDDEEEEEEEEAEKESTEDLLGRGHRRAILKNKTRSEQTTEEKRMEHQSELFEKMMEASRIRLKGIHVDEGSNRKTKSSIAYKGLGQMPKEDDVRRLRLFVDKKYEAVILPVFGQPTPFHISTIKNISWSVEGEYSYLRINFSHPGSTLGRDAQNFQEPDATFVKELTFRAVNGSASTNMNTVFRMIKEVQKRFRTREAEEREKADLVQQDTLVLSSNRGVPKLKDLFIRPNIVSKRITGALEAHTNGFRYTSIRGDKVDILYNNIRHAFYQPCDGEMIILLHFHLKHAIMFGKKKHFDVQFYTEVGEMTTDLGKANRMRGDRDDIEAEQHERELRSKLKMAFKSFCEKVENITKGVVEFDQPFRDLGFFGCPHRSTVLLLPTSSCLVNLAEWPPFVINLDEVEIVHFERVSLSIHNFDMVFIFKDYTRKVASINAIPATSLDHVKDWLNSCDIFYTEGVQSLNWTKILQTIVKDPEAFFEEGGWNFLRPEESEAGGDGEDEEDDDAYEPSDVESDGDESSTDEESDESEDWSAEQDSDDDSEGLDSDESVGKDWDQLEEEAKMADALKADEVIEEASRKPTTAAPTKKRSHSSRHSDERRHSPPKKKRKK